MQHAIDEARAIAARREHPRTRLSFDIEIRRGAGAYICGEETALFESIEGKRGEPRNKPPFPGPCRALRQADRRQQRRDARQRPAHRPRGRRGVRARSARRSRPARGCSACRATSSARASTKRRSARRCAPLIEMAGGLRAGRTLRAVLLGGAAGTFVRPDELDLKLTHEDTRAAGTTLGSGVVMVVDDTIDLRDLVLRIAAFFRDESCGQCVPCRVGTVRQEEALHRIASGAHARRPGDGARACSTTSASRCGTRRSAASARPPTRPSSRRSSACASTTTRGRRHDARRSRSSRSAGRTRADAPTVALTIDGQPVIGAGGHDDSRRCATLGITIPTLCYLETLQPVNVCRLCVVEVEGARVLVPSCSRAVEAGMVVHTRSPRVVHRAQARARAARVVGGPVDGARHGGTAREYDVRRAVRSAAPPSDARSRDRRPPRAADVEYAATVAQPVKIDNDLYVRDYGKCVLCYKCVEACGAGSPEHVRDRGGRPRLRRAHLDGVRGAAAGLGLRLLRQLHRGLPDRRADGEPRVRAAQARRRGTKSRQTTTDTICPYCGVGCTLTPARAGRRDRQGDLAARQRHHAQAICASRAGSAGGSWNIP